MPLGLRAAQRQGQGGGDSESRATELRVAADGLPAATVALEVR